MAPMTPQRVRLRPRSRRGNALVEFALVLPLLLLVFAGIVDFGFLFQRHEVLTNAVREGARIAVLPAGYDDGIIQARVTDYITSGLGSSAGLAFPEGSVSRATVTSVTPEYGLVTVSAELTYTYIILGPIVGLFGGTGWSPDITLRASATMRTEVAP